MGQLLVNDAGDVLLHGAYLSMLLYKFPVFYFTFFQYFIYHFSNDNASEACAGKLSIHGLMDSGAITVMSLDCQYKLTLGEHLDK